MSTEYVPATPIRPHDPSEPKIASARDLLQRTTIQSILQQHDVFRVTSEQSALDALHLITEKRVLALPVMDVRKRAYAGFIDLLDIVHVITNNDTVNNDTVNNDTAKQQLANLSCGALVDASTRNPYRAVESTASLHNAMQLMLNGKLHRLPVLDADGNLENLLTQSAVVAWINQHIALFPVASKSIQSLQLGYQEVVSINSTETASEAFKRINESKVSALAVVNAEGHLVDVISVSDLRIVRERATDDVIPIDLLNLSVADYLALRSPGPKRDVSIHGLVCVTPSTTIEELVYKVVATHVHRVFIIDIDNHSPIGVIALYDILKLANSACE